jgi:hypothetical protein
MKSYINEKWDSVVWSIQDLWYEAARRTGSVDTAVRLLFSMMAPGKLAVDAPPAEKGAYELILFVGGGLQPEEQSQYTDDLQALFAVSLCFVEGGWSL